MSRERTQNIYLLEDVVIDAVGNFVVPGRDQVVRWQK
jgi:hypothetical protein